MSAQHGGDLDANRSYRIEQSLGVGSDQCEPSSAHGAQLFRIESKDRMPR